MCALSVLIHNALTHFCSFLVNVMTFLRSLLSERHLMIVEHFASARVASTVKHVVSDCTLK